MQNNIRELNKHWRHIAQISIWSILLLFTSIRSIALLAFSSSSGFTKSIFPRILFTKNNKRRMADDREAWLNVTSQTWSCMLDDLDDIRNSNKKMTDFVVTSAILRMLWMSKHVKWMNLTFLRPNKKYFLAQKCGGLKKGWSSISE